MTDATEAPESTEVWTRREAMAWRRVEDEAVVLNTERRVLHGMNLTAWRVWEMLDGSHTVAEIATSLATAFGLSREDALRDVRTFIASLSSAKLIERAP